MASLASPMPRPAGTASSAPNIIGDSISLPSGTFLLESTIRPASSKVSSRPGDDRVPAHPLGLVQLGLRLHVEASSSAKTCSRLSRFSARMNTEWSTATRPTLAGPSVCTWISHLVAGLGLVGVEGGAHLLRVLTRHVEGQGVGGHLAARQDLIDQQLGRRRHGRGHLEGDVVGGAAGEDHPAARDHLVVEGAGLGGGRHVEARRVAHGQVEVAPAAARG